MQDFLIEHYLWTKSLHIIAVISWMAGLFYLPRLFVYHTRAEIGSEQDRLFQLMEARLLRIIMNPAMIASWVFGLLLVTTPGIARADDGGGWLYLKLAAVTVLTVFHMMLARWRRGFAEGGNRRDERFYRRINEVPTILMIVIVVMAVVKPF